MSNRTLNVREISERSLKDMYDQGCDKSQVSVRETTISEVEIASGEINLFRTVFDHGINLKGIREGKLGKMSGNNLSTEGVAATLAGLPAMIESSPVDAAYDIADIKVKKEFLNLPKNVDLEKMVVRAHSFLNFSKTNFPKVLMSGNLKYSETVEVFANSNGVQLERKTGRFENWIMFTSKDGKKTSSFDYTSIIENEMGGPLEDLGGARELMAQSVEHLEPQNIPKKFVGDVVMTPFFVEEILGSVLSNLTTDGLLGGQSLYKDSMDKKIMSDMITLKSDPLSPKLAAPSFYTSEGFLTEPLTIIDKGILRSNLLSQYGANKLGLKRATTEGSHLMMAAGTTPRTDLIKNVKQGILLRRLSAGRPSANGDFTGVAKNSYYIENGKIMFPIKEVMVSGNYAHLFHNVQGVSKETLNRGDSEFPWIHCAGVTVS
jgi:PmbA protein